MLTAPEAQRSLAPRFSVGNGTSQIALESRRTARETLGKLESLKPALKAYR